MGLMDTHRADGLTLENDVNTTEQVSLAETGDVVQENLKNQGLVSFIQGQYDRASTDRLTDETRWLESYRNFRGLYDSNVQFTDTEKSQAFIKITKTKVLAAFAQIEEIEFNNGEFPIGVESTPVPEGIADEVHVDPKQPQLPQLATTARPEIADQLGLMKDKLSPVADKLQEGPGDTPSAITFEPAKEAAKKLQKQINDQLLEAGATKAMRAFIFDLCLFGTGVFKGPTVKEKEYPRWSTDGEYTPVVKRVPDVSHVSIWDAYPDPDARNSEELEFFIQRHKLSKTQMRALKKRPFFRDKSIDLAIQDGPNYNEEYWEFTLRDGRPSDDIQRFEVLEYWGIADSDIAEIAEMKIPPQYKGMDQVQVNAWICNGQLLRLVFNSFTPARIPYFLCPYELNPYSIFGIGVAENMADTQLLMNGFMRLAVDNAVLSSNIIFEVDETNLVPGQDMKIYPGKIFRRQGGLPGQQIFATKFPNVTQETMLMFDKARQLADEATGMPSYAHGVTGIQSVNRTASGMSMLMQAASQNIKSVVRNIDDYLLVPLGKAFFAFNMQFNFDQDFVGDLDIVGRGTESLMRNEVRSQKMLQFLQLTNNPTDAPWVKRDYLLRELADSMDIDPDKAVNDPRMAGIQAMLIQQLQQQMGMQQQQGQDGQNSASVPQPDDATGNGGGNIAPGNVNTPGQQGFSGTGPRQNGPEKPNAQ
jgi:hypothetical protein